MKPLFFSDMLPEKWSDVGTEDVPTVSVLEGSNHYLVGRLGRFPEDGGWIADAMLQRRWGKGRIRTRTLREAKSQARKEERKRDMIRKRFQKSWDKLREDLEAAQEALGHDPLPLKLSQAKLRDASRTMKLLAAGIAQQRRLSEASFTRPRPSEKPSSKKRNLP